MMLVQGREVTEGFVHKDLSMEDSQTSLSPKDPEPVEEGGVGSIGVEQSHRRQEWLGSSQDWPR